MSDSDESGVTYTDISSPFEELSDIGSPRANDHEHLMLPEMLEDPYVEVILQAPPSPDYIPALRSQSRHHLRQIMSQVQSMLTMRLLLSTNHMLRMLHLLPSHLTPADSVVVTPIAADQAPSAEETEPFET
nr:hypothetical protein [Tanacetum cinerariifolium]